MIPPSDLNSCTWEFISQVQTSTRANRARNRGYSKGHWMPL